MKICLIMGGDEEGGLENHVVQLGNALAKKHEVHVIAHKKYSNRFLAVRFHALDLTRSRHNPFILAKIRKIISQISPNIVHAQANKAVSMIDMIKHFLPKNIKLVATLHSQKRNLRHFEKFDWVIGVSEKVLEKLETNNKSVIYNGLSVTPGRIKTRDYLLERFNIPESDKIFVSIGRLVAVKRFDILIEAFKGTMNAHLLIVGNGVEMTKLETLVSTLGERNVHFIGHRSDNLEILSAADICVISSEREGFPYVMTESLLVKTPIISTDVADMKKILPKHAVVAVNQPKTLNHLITEVNQNYEKYLERFEPTFEWAAKTLTFEKMVYRTNQVYMDLNQ